MVLTLAEGAEFRTGRADGAVYLNLYPPRPAAATQAGPAVPASGVVPVSAEADAGSLTLNFEWAAPVGAAVFRRGEAVWVVFDTAARLDLDGQADLGPATGVRWAPGRDHLVVRIAAPSGLAVVGVGLLENIEANRILLTYLAVGFVFLFLSVRLRSVVRSLLSMVPVLIAVGTASLVAWIFELQLSPMTALGGPLIVALCTEFTSLILLRFIEERQRGYTPREAMDVTARRTGRAFIVSALTAVAGVAVIAFSSLPKDLSQRILDSDLLTWFDYRLFHVIVRVFIHVRAVNIVQFLILLLIF